MSSYPSREQINQWGAEHRHTGSQIEFIVRKACDWQREQDTLICANLPIGNYEQGQYECAEAIRKQ